MTSQLSRFPGGYVILVHHDLIWHAYVGRYREAQQAGSLWVEPATNAADLEAAAWAPVNQQGWVADQSDTSGFFEFACPPDLAARAQFGKADLPLDLYHDFLTMLIAQMPDPAREFNLKPALALSRIKNIPSGGDWLRGRPSDVVLMHEYLRRAALWTEGLSAKGWPFYNIAAQALPTAPRPDDLFQQWKAHEAQTQGHFEFMTQWACYCYLHWSTISRDPAVTAHNLPAPYEPLIRLFERGGAFRRDQIGVEVGGRAIDTTRITPADYVRLPAWLWLDDGSLDWLDRYAEG